MQAGVAGYNRRQMETTPAIVCTLAAAAATPLILAALRRIEPLRHVPDARYDTHELEREFDGLLKLSLCLAPLLVLACGAALWWIATRLYQARLASLDGGITLPLPDILWAIPASLLGLFAAAALMAVGLRRLLGAGGYAAWIEFGNRRHGVDSQRLMRWLALLIVPSCLLLSLLAMDCYARVTERHFIVDPYWGLDEQVHRLDRVLQVTRVIAADEALSGRPVADYYRFVFDDGRQFGFEPDTVASSLAQQHAIARRTASLAGVAIEILRADAAH